MAPAAAAPRDELVDDVAAALVDAGVGLVEQPQLGAAGDEAGQRHAPALAGGELGRPARRARRPSTPSRAMAAAASSRRAPAARAQKRDVVGHREVVVEAGGVAEEPDAAADGAALAGVGQVVAEHDGLARRDRQQPGARTQQRRLAGAVRSPQEHDLAAADVEVDAGEGGEAAEQRDRSAEGHDRLHGAGPG